VYAVIPFDGTPVAVSLEGDFLSAELPPADNYEVRNVDADLNYLMRDLRIKPDQAGQFLDAKRLNAELSNIEVETLMFALSEFTSLGGRALFSTPNPRVAMARYYANFVGKSQEQVNLKFLIGRKGVNWKLLREVLGDHLNANGRRLQQELEDKPTRRFTTLANMIFTKAATKISVQVPGQLKLKGNEAWFAGKSIIIRAALFDKVLDELLKSGAKVNKNLAMTYSTYSDADLE
jgi:hypothetical protein